MQTEQAIAKPSGGGTSALSIVALAAALLALLLGGMLWWRIGMPGPFFAPTAGTPAMPGGGYGYGYGYGPGYGPGMMPWGGGPGYGMMPGGGYGMMGPGMMGYGGIGQQQTIAAALGITLDELIAAERAGKSIATLAQDKGVDLQKVIDAVLAPRKAAMAAMVSAGRMTQEQVDQITKGMEARLRARFATPFGPGASAEYGPWYGPGMMGPGYGPGPR